VNLNRIVVTGTTLARPKMRQSVSVSSITSEDMQSLPVGSATELLRSIPGVRAEATGGESNANLTVRGVPLSAGGSRYVQFQEDGLPVLLIGDISFATADTFLRADALTDSVDVIRGGSASTLATNSPGGIINFISRTGREGGGMVAFGMGLDHRQHRLDFQLGTRVANKTWLSLGGFHRVGEGTRKTDVDIENGGQMRLSLLHELDNGSTVRFLYKHLDDNTPTLMPVPVRVVNGQLEADPRIDPREAQFISSRWPQDPFRDKNGTLVRTSPTDGLQARSDAFGIEVNLNLADGLKLINRFRRAENSGRFIAPFPAGGQPRDYTGSTPVFSVHLFNTQLDDMGNTFNDLRLQKPIALGEGRRVTATGGLFTGEQRIAMTWFWNRYNVEATTTGARLFDNAGNVTTEPVAQGRTWGYCCMRHQDHRVRVMAPYAALTFDLGKLSVDASVRHDRLNFSGFWEGGNANNTAYDPKSRVTISNKASATSGSLGVNFEHSRDLATFARVSTGVSWASPDRTIVDAGNLLAASGQAEVAVNKTRQLEAGVKYRAPGLQLAATVFDARTKEDGGVEITTRTYLKNDFSARGVEAEAQWSVGDFRVLGGVTWTKAEITGGANVGKTPRRQPSLSWQLTPSWVAHGMEVGAQIVGVSSAWTQNDNTVKMPGFMVVNAFATFPVVPKVTLSLGVNNLFDRTGFTEGEAQDNGCCTPGGTPVYVARSVNGRSAKATLRYTF
jgi:outer membrane receptor protein involved in Fe transport